MKKVLAILIITFNLPTLHAKAEQPSFTYLEGGYTTSKRHGSPTTDGFVIRGSYEFSRYFYLDSSYTKNSYDFLWSDGKNSLGTTDVDLENYSIGLGAKFPLNENIAFYIEADYLGDHISYRLPSQVASMLNRQPGERSSTERGVSATTGIRAMIFDSTEFYTGYSTNNLLFSSDEIILGARYYIKNGAGLFAEYKHTKGYSNSSYFSSGIDNYKIGVSFKF